MKKRNQKNYIKYDTLKKNETIYCLGIYIHIIQEYRK